MLYQGAYRVQRHQSQGDLTKRREVSFQPSLRQKFERDAFKALRKWRVLKTANL